MTTPKEPPLIDEAALRELEVLVGKNFTPDFQPKTPTEVIIYATERIKLDAEIHENMKQQLHDAERRVAVECAELVSNASGVHAAWVAIRTRFGILPTSEKGPHDTGR